MNNCTCRQCYARSGNRSQRFYYNHGETMQHTIMVNDGEPYESLSLVIHGDPLPLERGVQDLWWTEEEMEALHATVQALKNGVQNPVSFEAGEELKIEVCFVVREVDRLVPHESLLHLSETLGNMFVGVLFPRWRDVKETFTYKGVTPPGTGGMIVVVVKNTMEEVEDGN